jgi:hypothetical protein
MLTTLAETTSSDGGCGNRHDSSDSETRLRRQFIMCTTNTMVQNTTALIKKRSADVWAALLMQEGLSNLHYILRSLPHR